MSMKPEQILVVDDEKRIVDSIAKCLTSQGLRVFCAYDGLQAISLFNTQKFELVLMDISMPDMDGYELYKRAKESQENLPIIMMTGFGYDPNHAVVRSRQAGLKNVVFKPFDITKLVKIIKSNLSEV